MFPRLSIHLFFYIIILTGSLNSWAGGLDYVTVQSEGTGKTVGSAVGSALSSAVAQVNGAALAATTLTVEARAALDTATESSFASASATSETVAQSTKGIVREYRIVSKRQDGPLYSVTVEATIAKYARSPQADRLRVSVLPFRLTKEGQARFRDLFVQELSANLSQSRKFAILDRQFESERQSEMAIVSSTDSSVEEMAKLGNRLGTDYMIVGTVNDAVFQTINTQIAGRTLSRTEVKIALSYRVIDAPTGQVKFSDGWSRSAEGVTVESLAKQGAEAISRQILDAIFPITVESVDGEMLYLGQGGKTMRVGQTYRLFRYGKPITDSHTGESLGREEIEIGTIKIVDVQSKIAKAKVVKASIDVAQNFAPSTFIARLLSDSQSTSAHSGGGSGAGGARAAPSAKQVDDMKKKAEGDW
jgi:hypothetical protein